MIAHLLCLDKSSKDELIYTNPNNYTINNSLINMNNINSDNKNIILIAFINNLKDSLKLFINCSIESNNNTNNKYLFDKIIILTYKESNDENSNIVTLIENFKKSNNININYEIVMLNQEKKSKVKSFLYWLKEEAKANSLSDITNPKEFKTDNEANIYNDFIKYIFIESSEFINESLSELTNYDYSLENQLFEFNHNSITQLFINNKKEVFIDYINLYIN